jgi:nucleotide-binding universal stress UspA family protein
MSPITWKRICCAVDFSVASRAALRVAIDLCSRLGADLTVLHVDDGEPARERADAWAEVARREGLRADVAEARGDPKVAIAEWADSHGADAILMGGTGTTGRARAFVGSVAESTVRRARCPVMVIHSEWSGLSAAAPPA